ncbi:coagulation factor 5/8 type domain-containing protein, partial [Streptomyces sp. ID05-04B]|nr:coagulation factor 5/8 type domain-containing protein [Streptomyces sp. ID05-04B]
MPQAQPPSDTPAVRRRAVLAAAATAAAAPALTSLAAAPASAAPASAGSDGAASAGSASADASRGRRPCALPGGGDLGPNVLVFDPSTPDIQARLDEVFRQQESAQFGTGRYALLFKPGVYHGLNAQLGFYTSIAGLGLSPDDTTINGDVTVDAGWFGGNATQNFWRSAENLALVPVSGTNRWAVAQAAPFRRMHVRGGLNLAPSGFGWASGGYIADSRIEGEIGPYSQQQWYTRDSSVGSWLNGVWNMVFSGVEGAPAQSFP